MILYLAGAYSGKTKEETQKNIDYAMSISKELWGKKYTVICPHGNTANFEIPDVTYDDYLRGDFEIISRCDALVLLPNWSLSNGAIKEKDYAQSLGVPVWYYPELPRMRERMTDRQEEHLARVIAKFISRVTTKYELGQREHGGNLFDKPNLPMLLEEVLDQIVYGHTLEDQIDEASDLCVEGDAVGAFNVLKFGNKDGKTLKDND